MSKKLTNDEFIKKCKDIYQDKYDYNKTLYPENGCRSKIKITVTCKTHGDFLVSVHHHLYRRQGCPICGGCLPKYTKINFMNVWNSFDIESEYELIDFSMVETAKSKFIVKHKVCNFIYEVSCLHFFLSNRRCPKCSESKGESFIANVLIKNNISFTKEFTDSSCRHKGLLRFDFCLPKYHILIEYHGKQHRQPIKYFGGCNNYITTRYRDLLKERWAIENGYKLLIIWFDDNDFELKILGEIQKA